jgi:predicted 2-oxoglutarate/Fe(II)-dependent dioxygenase YbiX
MTTVVDVLGRIGRSGTFAVKLDANADDLRLDVTGVGRVGFPVSNAKAAALCRVAKPARHGFKDQTVLDTTVRDTWEISKSRIKIDERRWQTALTSALERIARGLGLGPGAELRASLHNLLVYAPGQFFVTHQDSEKSDDMVATLVVTLPSAFSGGEIVVQHHGEKVTFRGSAKELGMIAFYADCHHEVRPVKSGHRIVLTYSLLFAKDRGAALSIAPEHLDTLEAAVRAFFRDAPPARWPGSAPPEPPDRLVYLLDHQYSQKGLGWSRLKSADAARAAALREAARRLDCEIALALADAHEIWSCEDEYDRGYRYDHDWEDEAESGDGEASATPELIELIDSSVELRAFVDVRGRAERVSSLVDSDELCFTKPSDELDPFQSEHEGYMGNWGNTVERWYHRAAVVLWPRSRTFVIRAKASARWAIAEIAKALGRRQLAEARRMAEQLVTFWSRTVRSEDAASLAGRALQVSQGLDDRTLAAALLRPFRVEHLTPKTAPALVGVVEHYGLSWFEKSCGAFIASANPDRRYESSSPDRRLSWLRALPTFAGTICGASHAEATELARRIIASQWTWVLGEYRGALRFRPSEVLRELARLEHAILGVLHGCVVCGAASVQSEVLSSLSSGACPPRALVHLLETAEETCERQELSKLGLATVHDHARKVLEEAARKPSRASDDWSIPPPGGCACALCKELARFLSDRGRTRLEWPIAENKRAHVHQKIDASELPVTHTTRRSGSPYTLVLEKTPALFEREAKERAARAVCLAWLARTKDAFGPFSGHRETKRAKVGKVDGAPRRATLRETFTSKAGKAPRRSS